MKYVVFLRGINVGGNKLVKMEDLRNSFESWGFEKVKTLLNSGNAIFEAKELSPNVLLTKIKLGLKKKFGWEFDIILRSEHEINLLIESDPFKDIKITPETRLYVTFLPVKSTSKLKIPYISQEKDLFMLCASEGEVCSAIILSTQKNTTDLMKIIDKEYGKNITTRNWNTILKIEKLFV